MFFSSMRERHVENKSTQTLNGSNSNMNGSSNNNSDRTRGILQRNHSGKVRQRATQQCSRAAAGDLNCNSSNNNGHNNNSNGVRKLLGTASSTSNIQNLLLPQGGPHVHQASSRILDALAHPAQAAAAAAAAGSQPQRIRGRKRKATASLGLLTFMCIAVVKYSGSMYDDDNNMYSVLDSTITTNSDAAAGAESVEANSRRAQLRSRSPDNNDNTNIENNNNSPLLPTYSLARIISSSNTDNSNMVAENSQSQPPNHIVLRNRIVHALKAAFVADAASMGTHWIYNPEDLKQVVAKHPVRPEFHSPPAPQFYDADKYPGHYGPGQASPYGEQFMFVTDHVASMARSFAAAKAMLEYDDDDERQADPVSIVEPMSHAMQEWAESFGGRPDHAMSDFLICRRELLDARNSVGRGGGGGGSNDGNPPPKDGGEKKTADEGEEEDDDEEATTGRKVEDPSCGANDDQAHFFLKIIPMTCLYVGHPHRHHYVEQAIRVHQNNDLAVMYGLVLSDLLERVLLIGIDIIAGGEGENNDGQDEIIEKPVKSLREALDVTLKGLQEQHDEESWFHFAVSLTQHHQNRESLIAGWAQARETAEQKQSMDAVAAQLGPRGRSCHMPGALILSLHALYRATQEQSPEETNPPGTATNTEKKKGSSSLTHVYKGYDYYVKALMGTLQKPKEETLPPKENTQLVSAIRENIFAAGDTCSRAILIAAVLGAAYGEPPRDWWQKMYPVLSGQVEEAAFTIADYASRRFHHRRRRRHRR